MKAMCTLGLVNRIVFFRQLMAGVDGISEQRDNKDEKEEGEERIG